MSTKGKNPYAVEWSRFSNGERLPFLIRTDTGLPIEAPTFWSVASRRAMNVQANTLKNELRSVMFLYVWADLRGVDLLHRLNEGTFFSLAEILDMVNVAGRRLDDVLAEMTSNVVSLNSRRGRGVQMHERRNRLSAAYSFIDFTSTDILSQMQDWPQRWDRYFAAKTECLKLLSEHVQAASKGGGNDIGDREGLEKADIIRLRAVIEPDHPDNPFEPQVRFRNYLIVRLLLDVGIRRGELLGIKTSDLVLGTTGTVTVHRRPDDPADPRAEKPSTKTRARPLPLNGRLTEIVHEYIVHHRGKLAKAKKHPYLIVSSVDGAPLSLSSVNKIFSALRKRVPDLPDELSPHIMRHTWNDTFSELADEKGISAEDEVKWRMRLMGWRSEASAAHYQQRTVRRRSNEFLEKMQDKMTIGETGDDHEN